MGRSCYTDKNNVSHPSMTPRKTPVLQGPRYELWEREPRSSFIKLTVSLTGDTVTHSLSSSIARPFDSYKALGQTWASQVHCEVFTVGILSQGKMYPPPTHTHTHST